MGIIVIWAAYALWASVDTRRRLTAATAGNESTSAWTIMNSADIRLQMTMVAASLGASLPVISQYRNMVVVVDRAGVRFLWPSLRPRILLEIPKSKVKSAIAVPFEGLATNSWTIQVSLRLKAPGDVIAFTPYHPVIGLPFRVKLSEAEAVAATVSNTIG